MNSDYEVLVELISKKEKEMHKLLISSDKVAFDEIKYTILNDELDSLWKQMNNTIQR